MRGGSVSQRRRSAGEEGDIIRNLRKEGGLAVPKTTSISSEIDSQELKTLRATDDLISNDPRAAPSPVLKNDSRLDVGVVPVIGSTASTRAMAWSVG